MNFVKLQAITLNLRKPYHELDYGWVPALEASELNSTHDTNRTQCADGRADRCARLSGYYRYLYSLMPA